MKKPGIFGRITLTSSSIAMTLLLMPLTAHPQKAGYNYATGNVQGRNHVGGLIGGVADGRAVVHDSYARGSVSGSAHVGSFAGSNAATISDSYATGQVSGSAHTGGLAGTSSGTINRSYWNTQTSGQSNSAGGEGRNTSAMTHPYASNTFVGWDFSTVWQSDVSPAQNNGYPRLRPSPVYELSLRVYPVGAGTVAGAGTYRANQVASISATALGEYHFTGWSHLGSVISAQSGLQVNLNGHATLTAHFEKQATSAGTELASQMHLRVYPNPARDMLVVEIPKHEAGVAKSVSLVNLVGQVLLTSEPDDSGQNRILFRLTGLTPGIYLVVAVFEHGKAVEKVIIGR